MEEIITCVQNVAAFALRMRRSIRSSNAAFLKNVRPMNRTWLIMQSLCLCRPLLISLSSRQRSKNFRLRHPGRPIHASKMFGSTSLTALNTTPSQNACSAKSVVLQKARTFSQVKAQVCIFFVVLIAHFPRFVQLKNKKRKDLMQT